MPAALHKKSSPIHGLGIFTKHPIKRGTAIYRVPLTKVLHKPRRRCARIGADLYVMDEQVLNWINHSCTPNTKLVIKGSLVQIVAKRNIKAGEEITCDYNQTEIGGRRVRCHCGDTKCRKYFIRVE